MPTRHLRKSEYPNCKCYKIFGKGMLCGDPNCEQVKNAVKNMQKTICDYILKNPEIISQIKEYLKQDTNFQLPDLRNYNANKTFKKK